MTAEHELLERLLGRPDLERLVHRLRRRLEHGGGPAVTLRNVSDAERRAVEQLLGRRTRSGDTLRVPLESVELTLRRAGAAPTLKAALEVLHGPLVDRRAARDANAARWSEVFESVRERADALALSPWLERLQIKGVLKRLAARDAGVAQQLLGQALLVLERLPTRGTSRSTLAAEALGDAHALDRDRPVSTLVRHALALRYGGRATFLMDERSIWASAGVLLCGDITSTVLVLNLPIVGRCATAGSLKALNAAGEPCYLTLRQLLKDKPEWRCSDRTVFVCENPTVVAEGAERLGIHCAPLIATLGRPRAAALTLLEQLVACGARLRYRGDFDWPGVEIANRIISGFGALPWRFDTETLNAYADLNGRALEGRPVDAIWDRSLRKTLETRGVALQEEQILDDLCLDLDASTGFPAMDVHEQAENPR